MPDAKGPPSVTAADRYQHLVTEREPYLTRARECAALTIPALMPPDQKRGEDLPTPFQSVGARGINNLAAKLLLALFPPGTSFFRLTVDPVHEHELAAASDSFIQELEKALSVVERAVVGSMEQTGIRATMIEVFKHILNEGNVLLEHLDNGGWRAHYLDTYVVKRDYEGNLLEIILRETLHKDSMPDELRKFVEENPAIDASDRSESTDASEEEYDLYTWFRRDPEQKRWVAHQEINGHKVPDTEVTDPLDAPRFHAVRLFKVDGEDYSRSFVEEYLGDLITYDELCRANVQYTAAVTKILVFVSESGLTDKDEVARAVSGAVLDGDARDVSILSFAEKSVDMQMADKHAVRLKQDLEQSFLLFSALQRNAERVTAEEIRTVAHELEKNLGGIYSMLAEELQTPMVRRQMHYLRSSGKLPKLPREGIQPKIIAGLEGLSRSSESTKLDLMLANAQAMFGPEALAEYVNVGAYLTAKQAALGIQATGIVRSEEEVQRIRQARMQAQIAADTAPVAAREALAGAREPEPNNA